MPALWPASCRHHEGHRRSGFCPGGMNDPIAVITGTVYSAVTLGRHSAKDFAYVISSILTTPIGGRMLSPWFAEEATQAWRG